MNHAWVIRAADEIRPYIQAKKAIGVGWSITSDISGIGSPEEMRRFFRQQPQLRHEPDARQRMTAPQLFAFTKDVSIGDFILTPLPAASAVLVGVVLGDYYFDPAMFPKYGQLDGCPHTRSVSWSRSVPRTSFSLSAIKTLNIPKTLVPADRLIPEIETFLRRAA